MLVDNLLKSEPYNYIGVELDDNRVGYRGWRASQHRFEDTKDAVCLRFYENECQIEGESHPPRSASCRRLHGESPIRPL